MTTDTEKAAALADLAVMIETAREKGLWIFCPYQTLWFSPDELAEENRKGNYRWGRQNWFLRDPYERVAELQKAVDAANSAALDFGVRLQKANVRRRFKIET